MATTKEIETGKAPWYAKCELCGNNFAENEQAVIVISRTWGGEPGIGNTLDKIEGYYHEGCH